MAQTVKIPRFYINEIEFVNFMGAMEMPSDHFRTLPVYPTAFNPSSVSFELPYDLANPYCAVLGHTGTTSITIVDGDGSNLISSDADAISINAPLSDGAPGFSGWSLMELTSKPSEISIGGSAGSVLVGSYWSPPFSPDLSVTLSHNYSAGIQKTMTMGGSTLSNSLYHGSPKWGALGAWEMGQTVIGDSPDDSYGSKLQNLSKTSRRSWQIEFSFLQESDLYPGSLNLATMDANNYEDDTLLNGTDDFFGQVVHRLAGNLPFIFSPDSTSSALDNFAICTLNSDVSFQQTAPGLYSCSLTVTETW